jgi:hypothetical protein
VVLLICKRRRLQAFDQLTLLALVYTGTVTPYEIGYIDSTGSPVALEVVNYIVLLVFAVGIVTPFFFPFHEPISIGGRKVKRIATRYLTSWFIIDLISTIPFDLMSRSGDEDEADLGEGDGSGLILRMVRLLRLLKLGKVLRGSPVLSRVAESIDR